MSIILIPVENLEPGLLPDLREALRRIFREEVATGEMVRLPERARNDLRDQYEAETVLDAVARLGQGTGGDRRLGITDADLYVPGLNFIFGLAKQRDAVISLHRLRQSFYGLFDDRKIFCHRVLVEAVHELGHTYGLPHCRNPACVMHFSSTIAETDRKGPGFCPSCHRNIAAVPIRR
ncbi:archaemetzincin family Zn-dependent metalloprotease [Methanoculleus sp. FWC-SCC1]|uniref:Archaemetzincin n=1 Tax=Methanoculleus frigidifontis TaxID=2584085 RepID=A0ABT8MAV4_9EURY|nr:archaemetzincin family Zn-dependent metalloprotease [Methanoculleus sp. FWC-SCC1]MDN7025025.1 archaemetzincin family Zn-dependent metalloprotease [Methanoculleus sp. FWC-SCC1]